MISQIDKNGIEFSQVERLLDGWLTGLKAPGSVLLVPPDITRKHSRAGEITSYLYKKLSRNGCKVKLLIALGSHLPMDKLECAQMFDGVPASDILHHDWRKNIERLGSVPADFIREVSGGLCDFSVDVEVNKEIFNGYGTIVSVGQVVPHEVVGMANGNKNIFVGCGGEAMINSSHFLGAVCGMERLMGRADTPVRKVFNYAEDQYLKNPGVTYILNVLKDGKICGLFIGESRAPFEEAAELSRGLNLTMLDRPLKKAVVYLNPGEYKSTWLGNKAVYRTRMAIADGGELLILAPGVERFGEDGEIDRLIRKYGYVGNTRVLELAKARDDLKNNLAAAAHLIHGSSDGRFSITYAVDKLTRAEIEGVGFRYARYADVIKKYSPNSVGDDGNRLGNGNRPGYGERFGSLKEGYNAIDGEEIFYIPNPAVGLWAERSKFK